MAHAVTYGDMIVPDEIAAGLVDDFLVVSDGFNERRRVSVSQLLAAAQAGGEGIDDDALEWGGNCPYCTNRYTVWDRECTHCGGPLPARVPERTELADVPVYSCALAEFSSTGAFGGDGIRLDANQRRRTLLDRILRRT